MLIYVGVLDILLLTCGGVAACIRQLQFVTKDQLILITGLEKTPYLKIRVCSAVVYLGCFDYQKPVLSDVPYVFLVWMGSRLLWAPLLTYR